MKKCIKCGSHAFNLYAEGIDQGGLCDVHYWQTKAQRPWVGLTKDERLELYRQFKDCLESDDWEYEKAIEAKLKELNT